MKELGSDFHYCVDIDLELHNELFFSNASYYANGRHALQDLILNNPWKRMWVPTYFCYEVIDAIKETGIQVELYPDAPTFDDDAIISAIPFLESDVLLRMNFFGLRTWRDNSCIPIPVVEDHSHDLSGEWASNSNADWCFASLRKTIPLPEGGVLWSPKDLILLINRASTIENDLLCYKRLSAMLMKTLYLSGNQVSKNVYRQLYIETEHAFFDLEKSSISDLCFSMFQHSDIQKWYNLKNRNWTLLSTTTNENFQILQPENVEKCNPYSLILKFNSVAERELCREKLMNNTIYPALLWVIPDNQDKEIVDLSQTILSVYCDARYNLNEMEYLKIKLHELLK